VTPQHAHRATDDDDPTGATVAILILVLVILAVVFGPGLAALVMGTVLT
jgi:uncharacterized membrane protein YdfJ with MMPL/SSD domain